MMCKKMLFAMLVCGSLLAGCSDKETQLPNDPAAVVLPLEKMTEEWCDQMLDKPNVEWVEVDIQLFARDCTYADTP